MTRTILTLVTLIWSSAAAAQNSVTLDSFSLNPTPAPADSAPVSEMRDCLLDQSNCTSAEFGGSAAITLDDVVNLGIIDRKEAAAAAAAMPAPTSQGTAALAVVDRADPEPLPPIDLEILFAYNSDDLTPEAMRKLSELSNALRDPRLANARLVFIGHTDAAGSSTYNMDLSRRRAESVANFVRGTMQFTPREIDAVGVGFTRLKNTFDPLSPQNRRVQLVLVPGA